VCVREIESVCSAAHPAERFLTPSLLTGLFELSRVCCRSPAGSLALAGLVELVSRNTAAPAFADYPVKVRRMETHTH
jgi:hypothetical protein